MKRICQIAAKAFFSIFFVAIPALAAHVAVLETVGEGDVLKRAERLYLTDRLREVAVKTLPAYMGYTIMTRENINAMLPPGKAIEDCEGSCLVETGKNISADFIAQARVNKFGSKLTISVELYETAGNKLVSSFTGRSSDADGLLEEIEKKAVSLFSAIKTQNVGAGGSEGFSGLQESESFNMNVNRQYVVRVNSEPEGAMLSVDGRPKCKMTPCNLQLVSGNHNFSFALDMYFEKDTSIDVQSNEQRISVALLPNFGILNLNPKLGAYSNESDLAIRVDGKTKKIGNIRLSAGKHHVEISHRCYEPMSFDVSVKNGSELNFDRAMQPAVGGLSLTAEGKKGPESLPVFVDGKQVGMTPYQETVPVCAKVMIGNAKDSVPVKLKYHETVEFVYKESSSEPPRDKDGNIYKTTKIGNQEWMVENLKVRTTNSWCYNDKESYCKKYGRLYTWEMAKNSCPTGWHLPNLEEFEMLFSAVGGQLTAGKNLKSTKGWSRNGNGLGHYSFTALPAGFRNNYGDYKGDSDIAYFWSSTEGGGGDYAWGINLSYLGDKVSKNYNFKKAGFSVRCVKDYSASFFEQAFVIMTDSRDGKRYKTIQVGEQFWMAENLNVKIEHSQCYDDEESNCEKYGRLYTWKIAKNACPVGWHLPSMEEFKVLFTTVGGKTTAGKMLKSTSGWNENGNGSGAYPFAALPAGIENGDGDCFRNKDREASFWSSTGGEGDKNFAYNMSLYYNDDEAHFGRVSEYVGLSVRCIKD